MDNLLITQTTDKVCIEKSLFSDDAKASDTTSSVNTINYFGVIQLVKRKI